ncbi:hypothetical protein ACJIZ3_017378 [Penstemon smallii]|uniref:Transmembrane protein n=1 Tax=Penstemon smallii TaxID=265156 RepID=A0ABD3SVC9_9LAMI
MAILEEKVGGGGDDSYPEPEDEEQAEEAEKESNSCRSGIQTLKSTFIISGMVVAVLGAICALAKKIKEA